MTDKEIIKYLNKNIEPMKDFLYGGTIYRASVYLKDNLFLPCVKFVNSKIMTDLAVKRINESCDKNYDIIKLFVTNGNKINSNEMLSIENSKFAFPIEILRKIRGETLMSWTGFVVEMNDGKFYNFGTTFDFLFFDLPEKYSQ